MQEAETPAHLREQADRFLRLAKNVNDPDAIAALRKMAEEYQSRASELEHSATQDGVPHPKMEPPPS